MYEGVDKLYVGRKVMIVIEFTSIRRREREGRNKIQTWALFWNIYGPGESNILSTDIDLDTLPRFSGNCTFKTHSLR
jgi:hypothetical protein